MAKSDYALNQMAFERNSAQDYPKNFYSKNRDKTSFEGVFEQI